MGEAEARRMLLDPKAAAVVDRLYDLMRSRCGGDYDAAWEACTNLANNAAHHAEDQALVKLLWKLNGRAARITIVSFGHGACKHCQNLFSFVGDVKKSRSVPAFLCPRGLDAADTGHWNGVYYIALPAAAA